MIKQASYFLFILMSLSCNSEDDLSGQGIFEEVALVENELKPGVLKANRLKERDRILSEYLRTLENFNPASIAKDRWPSYMRYNGPGGIEVTVFGVSSSQDMIDVFKKCWSIFAGTNVVRLRIKFYAAEERIEGKSKTWKYVPNNALFVIDASDLTRK